MLTPKQQKVLDAIVEFFERHGESPTLEELQNKLEINNKRSIVQFLEYLEEKGFIHRGRGYRSIRLGDRIVGSQLAIPIPILGFANAGKPFKYGEEQDLGNLLISKTIIKGDPGNYFLLKLEGTSMNQFHVNGKILVDGSYVLVNKDYNWQGDSSGAYVCIVNGFATVKKIKKEGNDTYLLPQSEDKEHTPIILSQDDIVEINGKIVDVFNFS
ncbi:MAG: S24 family peptidase [Candidatus Gracilibacteria bacterium]|nr:S24 family peptidase [Candidatus Gracilibacteria bacterium]MDD2908344.1 S24 family peptidase [Candidatus Gracilibacteria bacterium]